MKRTKSSTSAKASSKRLRRRNSWWTWWKRLILSFQIAQEIDRATLLGIIMIVIAHLRLLRLQRQVWCGALLLFLLLALLRHLRPRRWVTQLTIRWVPTTFLLSMHLPMLLRLQILVHITDTRLNSPNWKRTRLQKLCIHEGCTTNLRTMAKRISQTGPKLECLYYFWNKFINQLTKFISFFLRFLRFSSQSRKYQLIASREDLLHYATSQWTKQIKLKMKTFFYFVLLLPIASKKGKIPQTKCIFFIIHWNFSCYYLQWNPLFWERRSLPSMLQTWKY